MDRDAINLILAAFGAITSAATLGTAGGLVALGFIVGVLVGGSAGRS